ncbi:MAG TPA: glyoxylate/hydroxypyruvate reductase A [Bacteroidales bacterium]|nr:glyoxylate/hydroxypyruvate reductase A [Bacteroidales bacterium]
MAIVIASQLQNVSVWARAIQKVDKSISVLAFEEVSDPASVEFVLAWNQPEGILGGYPNLKTVSSMGAGVDHLMKDKSIGAHVHIVRIIDPLLSQDMFEFVLATIMSHLRMLPFYRENQHQSLWKKKLYRRISDVKVGIMGTGNIGAHVARKLMDAGFSVTGWGRSAEKAPDGVKKYCGKEQLGEFMNSCNVLVALLPLTGETRGILNYETLKLLPQGAMVINIGRGGLIVDEHLIQLLNEEHLEKAFLDVFHQEPLPANHPFWRHPGIYITPHIASLTHPDSVAQQMVENYYRTINNQPLINLVNRSLEY